MRQISKVFVINMRPWHLGMFFGILLILAMAVGHYRGYRKLKRFACMCLGMITSIGGLFFLGMGLIYIISDIRSMQAATKTFSGLGLGSMVGSGIFLFVGLPLITASVLLFRWQKG
jgi:hypothetical protein